MKAIIRVWMSPNSTSNEDNTPKVDAKYMWKLNVTACSYILQILSFFHWKFCALLVHDAKELHIHINKFIEENLWKSWRENPSASGNLICTLLEECQVYLHEILLTQVWHVETGSCTAELRLIGILTEMCRRIMGAACAQCVTYHGYTKNFIYLWTYLADPRCQNPRAKRTNSLPYARRNCARRRR